MRMTKPTSAQSDQSLCCPPDSTGNFVGFVVRRLNLIFQSYNQTFEPTTAKPTKWHKRRAKTQISLGIRPVWSVSLLSSWRKLGSLATHWVHSKDSVQTGQMPRLIWVFAGCTVILLVCHTAAHLERVVGISRNGSILLWHLCIARTDCMEIHNCLP